MLDVRALTQWSAAADRISHPPLALVFAKDVTATVLERRIATVRDLSRACWSAPWTSYQGFGAGGAREDDGWREYEDVILVITTTLAQLQKHGPHGEVWTRFGRSQPQSLTNALAPRNTHEDYMARNERPQAARRPLPGQGGSPQGMPAADPRAAPEADPWADGLRPGNAPRAALRPPLWRRDWTATLPSRAAGARAANSSTASSPGAAHRPASWRACGHARRDVTQPPQKPEMTAR